MKKMFNDSYHAGHSGMPPPGLVPELLACRACLATDTKLYTLDGALKDAYEYLMAMPLTTNMVRNVDRVSHKLLLKFTLGIDTKIIHVVHEDNDNKCNQPEGKTIDSDDIDGLTDVLNDFDEITKTLNDDVHLDLSEDEFDVDDGPFIDRARDFDVEELFKGKGIDDINEISNKNASNVEELFKGRVIDQINEISNNNISNVSELFKGKGIDDINEIRNKSISNDTDIGDIIQRAFKGKDKAVTKSIHNENLVAVKNEDTSSTFRDAEEVLKANLGDNLPPDDVSINTNDLNDTDSNLVDAFNNFILDHDYLDEKFLLESGDPEFMKKHVISKKTDEDSLLKEIIPSMSKKDKKLLKERDSENTVKTKPVKNLSKLKEINRRAKLKIKTEVKESKNQLIISKPIKMEDSESKPEPDNDKPNSKAIITKPELPTDGTVKSELSKEFIKFGADFNFRIFELSAEQQLEELQKKREGVLYLGAPYKCVDCAKGFHSAQTFGNHKRVHDPSYGQFPCAVCRARHKSDARRRRHADTHRLKYCCTQCEFVARSRDRAEQHCQWHAGKKFSCQHCGEQFGKMSTQLSHIRLQHPGACAWCALCGEPFVGALGLRQHTRRKHPQVIKHEERAEWHCGTCRVQFRSAELFRRHSASGCTPSSLRSCCDSLESAQGARVQCLACSAWFSSVHSRQTHFERVHLRVPPRAVPAQPRARTAPSLRPAMCEVCGNKYHSAAALSYHRRTHTGERPFACPRCPKSFTHNHTLQAHMRTHTGERPYRCSQCTRAFPTANNLARHNRIVHLGQRQYSRCTVCRRWLSSPAAARAHARRVHGDRL